MSTSPTDSDGSDVEWRIVLLNGALLGAAAFAAGVAILHAIFVLDPPTSPALADSALMYGLLHGIVRVVSPVGTGGTLLGESVPLALLFATFPALPLVVAGYLAARRYGARAILSGRGPLVGAGVVAGYAPLLLLAALLLETQGTVGTSAVVSLGVSLDPWTALLAAVLFAVVFGAVGGMATRSRRSKIGVAVFAVVTAVPSLFLLTGLLLG